MYLAYSLLTLVAFVAVSPYFLYQALRYQKYIGSLRQRLGFLPITVNVDANTKVRRKAPDSAPAKTLDSLALGDIVKLAAKACKADLRNGGTPDLTAKHIKARPPAATPPPPPAP